VSTVYLIAGGLAVIGLLAGLLVFMSRREGRASARLDTAEKGVDHAKEALEIEEANRGLSDADVDKRLFGDKS
jgi:hypothetical protein